MRLGWAVTKRPNSELMNSKNQFQHPPVARVVVDKKKKVNYKDTQAQDKPGV